MRARCLAVALGLLVAAGTPAAGDASAASKLAAQKVKPPAAGKLYWGDYRAGSPYSRSIVRAIEKDAGRKPAVVMWYQEWAGRPPFPYADAGWLARRGEVPMLSWEAWQPSGRDVNQPAYRLKRIAAGAFDPFIKSYARQIRDYGGPLMLRPFHEMDGVWYPWGGMANGNKPKDFVAAWRHVHKVFDRVGARNVTWVWSVNGTSVPNTPANSIAHYWPGTKYVDWIGVSAFNYAGAPPGLGPWESLKELTAARFTSLKRYHKPVFITETSSVEDNGDKGAWIRAIPGDLLGAPVRVGGFVWYDQRESTAQNFPFGSSTGAWDAFKAIVSGHQVLSAPSALPSRSH
jgi:hypothetical protein